MACTSDPPPKYGTFEVKPNFFTTENKEGDYSWMVKQEEYKHALFIFNDNTEDHKTVVEGKGNGAVRPLNNYRTKCDKKNCIPRSAGISTGQNSKGFTSLTDDIKTIIDAEVAEIVDLLLTQHYNIVSWSATTICFTGFFCPLYLVPPTSVQNCSHFVGCRWI